MEKSKISYAEAIGEVEQILARLTMSRWTSTRWENR